MTDIDTAQLRALAEEAKKDCRAWPKWGPSLNRDAYPSWRAFGEACSPDRIIALLDELDRLRPIAVLAEANAGYLTKHSSTWGQFTITEDDE